MIKKAIIIFKKSTLDDKGVLQMDFNPNITPVDVIKNKKSRIYLKD